MDAKLTLKLEKEVIDRAKRYARRQGLSLSLLVERYFREVVETGQEAEQPELHGVTAKLAGMLDGTVVEDWKRDKADRLARKYL